MMEIDAPSLAQLRKDNELPMTALSKTDREDPKRVNPNTDSDEPNRAKLLKESALPTETQSRTEKLDPKRVRPKIDT